MEKLIYKLKNLKFSYFIFTLLILLPNARAIFKYSYVTEPAFLFLIYIFTILALIQFFKNSRQSIPIKDFFSNPLIIAFIIVSITFLISYLYPIADGLKEQLRGSDQDDCVIIGATLLSKFAHPYSQQTYFGNPCSQGLGMLILYVPFVLIGFYPLGAIFFSCLAIWIVNKSTVDSYRTFVFSLILLTSVFWFELLTVGSDLILLGSGIVIISYSLSVLIKSKSTFNLIILSIFSGLIASTRINFMILPPLFSLFILKHWKKGALIFFVFSSLVSLLPSVLIYFYDPELFVPLHLVNKSDIILQHGLKQIAIVTTIFAVYKSYKLSLITIDNIPLSIFISLFPSLFFLSIGDLINSGNISIWEGANYLMPIFPLSASLIAKTKYKKLEN